MRKKKPFSLFIGVSNTIEIKNTERKFSSSTKIQKLNPYVERDIQYMEQQKNEQTLKNNKFSTSTGQKLQAYAE